MNACLNCSIVPGFSLRTVSAQYIWAPFVGPACGRSYARGETATHISHAMGARPRGSGLAGRDQVLVQGPGFLRVLVDLVFAQQAPGEAPPDHVAILVDALGGGGVEVNVAADADRLLPGEALEDDLIGIDLQARLDEALQPELQLILAFQLGRPGAVARKAEADVLRVEPQGRADVAFPNPRHVAGDQLLGQPGLHRRLLRSWASLKSSALWLGRGGDSGCGGAGGDRREVLGSQQRGQGATVDDRQATL